jgi:hypothetical protein
VGLSLSQLEGRLLRVRGTVEGTLAGATVEPWYPVAPSEGESLALEGVVTRFDALGSMQVDGVPVDASAARVSGRSSAIGIGARVEVVGSWQAGILKATRLKLRSAAPSPTGAGGGDDDDEDKYSARGNIGAYRSTAAFKVQGQDVDASGSGVVFANGTAADLRNGRRVLVTGRRVVDDVLVAERVEFL